MYSMEHLLTTIYQIPDVVTNVSSVKGKDRELALIHSNPVLHFIRKQIIGFSVQIK